MALSDDLRKRVVEAVVCRRAIAQRGGKAFQSQHRQRGALGQVFRERREPSRPSPCGGDRRSRRIEAHHDYLMGLIRRTPDITLLEIQERLIKNCGEHFSSSVLWRFFDRHDVTFKKRARMPLSSNAQTC